MKNRDAAKNNPCLKEQELTYKCYNDNGFDKEACQSQIDNYNLCKSFWNSVKADRRKHGVYPTLPPVEDRERIKREFMDKIRSQK